MILLKNYQEKVLFMHLKILKMLYSTLLDWHMDMNSLNIKKIYIVLFCIEKYAS